jgi:CRISPR-associated protein Cas2
MKGQLLSAYRSLWLIAMFDLPVETPTNKRDYARFRKALLKDGFMMLQFSIYARYLPSEEAADSHRNKILDVIPPLGQVRLMTVTDHQFGKMEVFYGRKPREPRRSPGPNPAFLKRRSRANLLLFSEFDAA